ncbi:phosphatidylserine/phosphatidylglycerophosphate/cardiolipin synthase family protein [Nonomuraea sp. KC401]|uniref:phospholipase D-like domain-containing protein n=1 Tax=unclassified Nonomuraea TaxID=2593643 RepID=UPI0010FF5D10|nr:MULTISPECIES: phospholipase D-like domain-containing protein [unclassified Nonomuraea]NBE94957.1 phosphatidylserine/phosphatidylglycerophosphate/cardiolipin synthase family protein [Nonomuraea sp. K271]TLF74653.1 phosphatidylserine/phosphatidylglycerophosphate/cardiolipin synthase family protein [Nonomuraea sp. KC401]
MPGTFLPALATGALLATAVLAGAGPAAAASASTCADAPTAPVRTEAVFNDPVSGDGAALVRRLCGLVRQTPPGARIQVAHFVMSGAAGKEFAGELIKAHQRDVDVQVVLDGDKRGAAVAGELAAALGTDTSARSWLHVCTGPPSGGTAACIGDKGQHNKFYLFSRTGRASDVVVQSSANLTDLNSTTYWNNVVVLPGNRRLYAAYAGYFADLAAERKNLDYYRVVQTGGPGGSVRAHFFPKADGDPIVDHLGKVSCRGGTTIRVGMSEWDAYRVAIPQRLRDLAARGCTVRIVYGIMDDEVKELLLAEPRVELRALGDGDALPGRVHSKYLLIEGSYDGDRHARRVFTGSHNYNETSLRRNDEVLLRLNNRAVYEQYVANFERMREVASPATQP